MKKFLLAAVILVFAGGLFAQTIKDENAEARVAKNFHSLKVSNAFDVYLTQGNEEELAVSASDKKYISAIKTEVKDGELRITIDGDVGRWNSGKMKLKAYVSFKNLDKLHVSGACDIHIMGVLKSDELIVEMSGASDIKGKIEVKKLDAKLSGASDMKISGSSGDLKLEVNGASDFKGFDFAVDYCYAEASGASDIQITVNKELAAKATGASDIHYRGEGRVRELRANTASSVRKTGS